MEAHHRTGDNTLSFRSEPHHAICHRTGIIPGRTVHRQSRKTGLNQILLRREFLDNLGAGRGVTRKQPAPAETTLRFTLSEKRPAAVGIPEGTKVTDGNLNYFATVGYEEIPAGETYVDVRALCTENGVGGNELLPGQVNVLVDLIPYVESVSNTTKTSGGADLESDESLAERIFLAPSGYSVAGPDDAYKYWTKTYSQTIGDVKVTSPNPVEVEIRFIMTDG